MGTPRVGDVLWYYPAGSPEGTRPLAAMVWIVHGPEAVGLMVVRQGMPWGLAEVRLVQADGKRPETGDWCEFRPSSELEEQVAALTWTVGALELEVGLLKAEAAVRRGEYKVVKSDPDRPTIADPLPGADGGG